MKKILIVGGVAGGATTAARLRRLNEDAQIIMFERDEYISFANCGLPYYIGGTIKERTKLLVQTVEGMARRYNLDIRNFSEVVSIDRTNKTVTVKDKKSNREYQESYDVLILSPGAKPLKPPIKGIENATALFTLRNIPDTDAIKQYTIEHSPKTATVIGGGFIGIEMAENLRELGIDVTLVEKLPQVLRPLDFEMAQIVHQELNANGVGLVLGDGVAEFRDDGRTVVLESGKEIQNDMVILAIGVAPENSLAKGASLALGPRGHIKTNEKLQTIDAATGNPVEDIYAIGDAIEVHDAIDGSPTAIPLAWPANRQGRLAADSISGRKINYQGTLGTSVAKAFSLTISSTGNNETQLKAKNIPYLAIHAHRANHASYYPGSSNIALKLLFSPNDGKILGAQAVGKEGTEKRIDVIATVIKLGGTVYDLPDLELAYAPPYSSAKDPVNILGYIASNAIKGEYKFVQYNEIDNIVKNGGLLIDVRTPIEYNAGHIEGSVNIPLDDLRDRIGEIKAQKDQPIYVTCQVGMRAHVAVMLLKGAGYTNVHNLSGGYMTYRAAKYVPSEKGFTAKPEQEPTLDTDNQTASFIDDNADKEITVDARGLQCPGPLMATYKAVERSKAGGLVKVTATDFGFVKDIESWCKANGHELVSVKPENGEYTALLRKGGKTATPVATQENATIVVFSGELDKAIAAMVIAQGAAANGKKVAVFFTFWGLNVLRKSEKAKTKKTFIEKMFGKMMPRGARKLPLSNMNMLGFGPKMIKSIMKNKNVDDLQTMMEKAKAAGVKFIACTMSMDLMGIKREELIDGIEYGGVATYMSHNENVGTTLFV